MLALRESYSVGKEVAMVCHWLRSRLPPVLKLCKLQYEMDLTLENSSVFKKIVELL